MTETGLWGKASWREVIATAVLGVLVGLVAQTILIGQAVSQETASASRTAATLAAGLRSEIDKFELVTTALSTDREARDLLSAPSPQRTAALNQRLSSLRDALGASVIYLMDRRGDTLVASNWRQPDSFVGQNYRFRSYFRDALLAGEQRQYALGTRSRLPGLYLARRIGNEREQLGVIVVKIRFDTLENDWRNFPGTVFATNPDGVVLITDDPSRRFRTIRPLGAERRAELRQQLDFGAAPLMFDPQLGGGGSGNAVAVAVSAGSDLDLHVIQPMQAARRSAILSAWLITAALFSTLAAAVLIARSRQQANRLALERHTAQRIDLLKDELAQTNRLAVLGQVAAGVGHEIGQPVSAIALQADTGRQLSAAGDLAGAAQAFHRIGELTGRITAITSELRRFSRRTARGKGPASIDEVIGGALLLLSDRIAQTGTQIDRLDTAAGLAVEADLQRCEQILVNLLQNALDTAAGRTGAIIVITVAAAPGVVTIDIADNGPGLTAEARATLFQPFKTSKPSGLGLGLVISQDIAHDLGGDLVLLEAACGACFRLTLPAAA